MSKNRLADNKLHKCGVRRRIGKPLDRVSHDVTAHRAVTSPFLILMKTKNFASCGTRPKALPLESTAFFKRRAKTFCALFFAKQLLRQTGTPGKSGGASCSAFPPKTVYSKHEPKRSETIRRTAGRPFPRSPGFFGRYAVRPGGARSRDESAAARKVPGSPPVLFRRRHAPRPAAQPSPPHAAVWRARPFARVYVLPGCAGTASPAGGLEDMAGRRPVPPYGGNRPCDTARNGGTAACRHTGGNIP